MMDARDDAGGGTGSARRRRERRFRAHLRFARMSVAMALAESTHQSSRAHGVPESPGVVLPGDSAPRRCKFILRRCGQKHDVKEAPETTTTTTTTTTTLRGHFGSSFGPCVTSVFALLPIRDFMWMMRGPLSEPAKEDMSSVAHATAAARRRQRRLRQFLRHERLTVAMLLAERDHHTAPRGQKQARSGEEVRVARHGQVPEQPPQPELFDVFDEEPGGGRPASLSEVAGWQRTVEQLADVVPRVQILDIPAPQMGDQLVAKHLDKPIPEQVIEVPKISSSSRRSRMRRSRMVLLEPQTAEQSGGVADCRVSFLSAAGCRADH